MENKSLDSAPQKSVRAFPLTSTGEEDTRGGAMLIEMALGYRVLSWPAPQLCRSRSGLGPGALGRA